MSRDEKQPREYDPAMAPGGSEAPPEFCWFGSDDRRCRLEGVRFRGPGDRLRRLPDDPALPEAVRHLAAHTSGLSLGFITGTGRLRLKVKLYSRSRHDHMPATGDAGFDLYWRSVSGWHFVAVTRLSPDENTYEADLLKNAPRQEREFLLNYPLYSGVESVEIGIDPDASLRPPPPRADSRPVVIYGSSITQGACASRPGQAFANILSRRLGYEFLNYGFSGNGKGEPAVIDYLAQVPDPAMFILDYEANAGPAGIRATLEPALRRLRRDHAAVPIVILTRIPWGGELLETGDVKRRGAAARASFEFQKELVERLRGEGDRRLRLVDGSDLAGEDWDAGLVDGTHPNDLGFRRMADALEPLLRDILISCRS